MPHLFLLSVNAGGSTTTAQAANKNKALCVRGAGRLFPSLV